MTWSVDPFITAHDDERGREEARHSASFLVARAFARSWHREIRPSLSRAMGRGIIATVSAPAAAIHCVHIHRQIVLLSRLSCPRLPFCPSECRVPRPHRAHHFFRSRTPVCDFTYDLCQEVGAQQSAYFLPSAESLVIRTGRQVATARVLTIPPSASSVIPTSSPFSL